MLVLERLPAHLARKFPAPCTREEKSLSNLVFDIINLTTAKIKFTSVVSEHVALQSVDVDERFSADFAYLRTNAQANRTPCTFPH